MFVWPSTTKLGVNKSIKYYKSVHLVLSLEHATDLQAHIYLISNFTDTSALVQNSKKCWVVLTQFWVHMDKLEYWVKNVIYKCNPTAGFVHI